MSYMCPRNGYTLFGKNTELGYNYEQMIGRKEARFIPDDAFFSSPAYLSSNEVPYNFRTKEAVLSELLSAVSEALHAMSSGPFFSEDHILQEMNQLLMEMALFTPIGTYFSLESFIFSLEHAENPETQADQIEVHIAAVSPQWRHSHANGESDILPLGTVTLAPTFHR